MKVVLDTNLFVSALVYRGVPGRLLLVFEDSQHSLYSSPQLMAELTDVLQRPKFSSTLAERGDSPISLLQGLAAVCRIVRVQPLSEPICRDPDDDAVLACARASRADLIASGDKDLLALGSFDGIPIVTAARALEVLSEP